MVGTQKETDADVCQKTSTWYSHTPGKADFAPVNSNTSVAILAQGTRDIGGNSEARLQNVEKVVLADEGSHTAPVCENSDSHDVNIAASLSANDQSKLIAHVQQPGPAHIVPVPQIQTVEKLIAAKAANVIEVNALRKAINENIVRFDNLQGEIVETQNLLRKKKKMQGKK